MASPVAIGVGIIATTVFLGGVDAAKSLVDNSAWTGGATAGVVLHGLPHLVDGFQAGSGTPGNSKTGFLSGVDKNPNYSPHINNRLGAKKHHKKRHVN